MFNMPYASGDFQGYQLRIGYNADTKQYSLTGYLVYTGGHCRNVSDRDGQTIYFDSLEAVLEYIAKYPSDVLTVVKLP